MATTTTITPPPVQPVGTATPNPPSTGPAPWRWTIEQYRQLGPTRIFDGLKTMLLDGEIYTMTFPKPPHNTALNLTYEFLRAAFPTGHHVRNQMAFDIGTKDSPGPDLAIVTGSIRDYTARQPTSAVMIVEIADTSLALDTTTKAELYATAGVADYWVVDLENRQFIVFRDPKPLPKGLGATAYATRLTFGPNDSVSPLAAPNSTIRVADLLP